jgi:uncharacterized cupredoxin-like copper-binding protein
MFSKTPTLITTGACAVALALAGCGGSSSTTQAQSPGTTSSSTESTGASTATQAGGPTALTVTMSDFKFTPQNVTAPAGKITLTAPNTGKAPHELVLIKFRGNPGKLPTLANGEANEDAFSEAALPGEIGETEPGDTGSLTVTLPAGKYVMLCNVPGHYKAGMYGTLTVQ